MSWRQQLSSVGVHAVLMFASAIALYPVLWVLKMALSTGQRFDPTYVPWPSEPSGEHFAQLLSFGPENTFYTQLFNSLVVSSATTVIGVLLACSAAYAFSRFTFVFKNAGLSIFLLTQILPGVVMLIPLYVLLGKLHLLNTLTGLVMLYSTTAIPFSTYMLKGYFDTVPKDLDEAALLDGASRLTIFFRIALPLARPAIAVTALFSFMTAWNEFVLAATLLSDEGKFTLPVALQRYVGEFRTDWGSFAAGAIIVSIPVMALFYALQKHLVGGLTAGSVKG